LPAALAAAATRAGGASARWAASATTAKAALPRAMSWAQRAAVSADSGWPDATAPSVLSDATPIASRVAQAARFTVRK